VKALGLWQVTLRRHAAKFRSSAVVALVFLVGFSVAWLWPDHTATPRRISGTVTWSNADWGRLTFVSDDDSGDSGEFLVDVIEWFDRSEARYSGGTPACLASSAMDSVRTDRRRVELEVISASMSDAAYRIAVVVHCLT
jgi:hypothetical protein